MKNQEDFDFLNCRLISDSKLVGNFRLNNSRRLVENSYQMLTNNFSRKSD